jgi:DNA-binding NtrC family response regulator
MVLDDPLRVASDSPTLLYTLRGRTEPMPTRRSTGDDAGAGTGQPASILLVEDEPGIQLAIRGLLRREGHTIRVVGAGKEALATLEADTFDLVLTDLSLPDGVTGLDLVRYIGAHRPGTPVVLITAFGSENVAKEAIEAGAFDYVPKPFNNDEIRAVVSRALSGRGAR